MINVDTRHVLNCFGSLLALVEQRGEWVRICRNGKPVADLRPVARGIDPLKQHAELLGVRFDEDPVRPLAPEDGTGVL